MRRLALVVLSVLALACSGLRATPGPTDLTSAAPSVEQSAVATPPATPTSSQGVTTSPEEGSLPPSALPPSPTLSTTSQPSTLVESQLAVPADKVQTLDLSSVVGNKQIDNLEVQGSLFAFSVGPDIYLGTTDSSKAVQVSKRFSAQAGDQILQLGMGFGGYIFWIEGHYDQNPNRAPCEFAGALTWSLVTSPGNGDIGTTASGSPWLKRRRATAIRRAGRSRS